MWEMKVVELFHDLENLSSQGVRAFIGCMQIGPCPESPRIFFRHFISTSVRGPPYVEWRVERNPQKGSNLGQSWDKKRQQAVSLDVKIV
jgi:hypothetical protein